MASSCQFLLCRYSSLVLYLAVAALFVAKLNFRLRHVVRGYETSARELWFVRKQENGRVSSKGICCSLREEHHFPSQDRCTSLVRCSLCRVSVLLGWLPQIFLILTYPSLFFPYNQILVQFCPLSLSAWLFVSCHVPLLLQCTCFPL